MAALLMTTPPSSHTISTLLTTSKSLGISKQGELFHTDYILALAKEIQIPACVVPFPTSKELCLVLDRGGILLFAYDKDKDNSPTRRDGRSAHWAIVISYLLSEDQKEGAEEIVLVCRHGKSRLLGYWSYKEVKESNSQLNQAGVNGDEWEVPCNLDGLRGLAVVLYYCATLKVRKHTL
jgi:hypothetical protein